MGVEEKIGRGGRLEGWKGGRLEGWKGGRLEGWKGGRLEGWKIGRVEGWKIGRVEGWKIGRVEGWKIGRGEGVDDECLLFLQITVENCSKKLYHETIPFDTTLFVTALAQF